MPRILQVDRDKGSDDADGVKAPLRTIGKAVQIVEPLDTIRIGPGVFNEGVRLFVPRVTVEGATGDPLWKLPTAGNDRFHFKPLTHVLAPDNAAEAFRYDLSALPAEQQSAGKVSGLKLTGGTRANLFLANTHDLEMVDVEGWDGGIWGMLTGFCQRMFIHHCQMIRSHGQHTWYFSNSTNGNRFWYNLGVRAWNAFLQFNADASQGGDGLALRNSVKGNMGIDCGYAAGPVFNGDGFSLGEILDNVFLGRHAGVNLHKTDATEAPHDNLLARNKVVSVWTPFNLKNGVRNVTAQDNLYSLKGDPFDFGQPGDEGYVPAVGFVESGNVQKDDPLTAEERAFVEARVAEVEPYAPPAPPPTVPPPPPPPLPDFPPDGSPLVLAGKPMDVTLLDPKQQGTFLLKVWNKEDSFGDDQAYADLLGLAPFDGTFAPIAGYHRYGTPGFSPPGMGWTFEGGVVFDRTDVLEVKTVMKGTYHWNVAGVKQSGSVGYNGHEQDERVFYVAVEAGVAYPFLAGTQISKDYAITDVSIRWRDQATRTSVPLECQFPPKERPPLGYADAPLPPVVPPPPPPPPNTNPGGGGASPPPAEGVHLSPAVVIDLLKAAVARG